MRSALLVSSLALAVGCAQLNPAGTGASGRPDRIGAEAQAYRAGWITAAHVEVPIDEHVVVTGRFGWNETDRRDRGEHDDEQGGGGGAGLGFRRFWADDLHGWFFGARVDAWWLEIDWRERRGGVPVTGTTDVVVVQPAAELGYGFDVGDGWRLDVSLSLGVELDVDTRGEDVGQGAILLGGITLTR